VLPPSVFWPRPKVNSAILHITVDEAQRARIPDREFFHDFVRSLFLHRRKFLRGVLQSRWKNELGKSGVDQALAETQLNPEARAEQLTIEEMLALCETIRRMTGAPNKE
jgi:16S rRNA (adenine1518-N6/adenine1519-N6)-dimethyltransferase